MVAAKIGVLFLIVVALGLAIVLLKGWSVGSPGRRPVRRHWITRVVCGGLGGGLLLAFLVVTVRDVRAFHTSARPIQLRIPTLPAPEAPKREESLKGGRFLLQMVVTQAGGFPGHPIASESHELQWPRDRNLLFALSLNEGSSRLQLTQTISEIRWDGRNKLEFIGATSLASESPNSSRSRSGGTSFPSVLAIDGWGHRQGLFSLMNVVDEDLLVLCDLTWVRDEDPLRPASLEEWIALRGESSWKNESELRRYRPGHAQESGSPAAVLAQTLGINVLPALAAALLLAQLFRRRFLGIVQVTAGVILYFGALDRIALYLNENQTRDPSAPLEARMNACAQLQSTVYFRKSALADLRALAADGTAPKPLRARADQLIGREK